jgi:hypothetical protein
MFFSPGHLNKLAIWQFEDPRISHRRKQVREAEAREAQMPRYKRDLRRKLLRLSALFRHRYLDVVATVCWRVWLVVFLFE